MYATRAHDSASPPAAPVGLLGVRWREDRTNSDRGTAARDRQHDGQDPDGERRWCREVHSGGKYRGACHADGRPDEQAGQHVSDDERARRRRREELYDSHVGRLAEWVQSEDGSRDVDTGEDETPPTTSGSDEGSPTRREECGDEDDNEREKCRERNRDSEPADPQAERDRQRPRSEPRQERLYGSACRALGGQRRPGDGRRVALHQAGRGRVGEPEGGANQNRHCE